MGVRATDESRTPAMIEYALRDSSLGTALIAVSEKGVCVIALGDAPEPLIADLHKRFPKALITEAGARSQGLIARALAAVEAGESPASEHTDSLPLHLCGTPFQQAVWAALREIGPGAIANYAGLAQRLGAPKAIRAVAGACAANPVAVVIPCHRVLRSDGSLCGYRWGVDRKRRLLQREGARCGLPLRRVENKPSPKFDERAV